jgi:para-aminobenzoate synthetase component 1
MTEDTSADDTVISFLVPTRPRPPPLPAPRTALSGLIRGRHPFLLESSRRDERYGRHSFAGADPFLTVTARGRRVEVERTGVVEVIEDDPLAVLGRLLAEHRIDGVTAPTPLPAGAVGFLSYDLARGLEKLPDSTEDDLDLPDLFFGFYDTVLTWDHATREATVSATGRPERAEELIALALSGEDRSPGLPRLLSPLRSTFTKREYLAAVSTAKELIAAGDIFQVNLSQRFSAAMEESGHDVYRRLVHGHPAAFGAYLTSPCGAEIVSASPERFLRVSDDLVEACPIKGTRPRSEDPVEDKRLARELLESEKDLAELTMIVDLLRSDLGKVAAFGSVRVPELPGLTSHPTVHHLHGVVHARLAEGRDVTDLLRVSFPCGSVTGAPKVRAMEIIEELEPVRRGVYTGAFGYLSFTGETDLSVAIRTMVLKDGRATFSVGGGIVADSDPLLEYEETLHKGRGLAAALGYML